jgi:ATP-binding cassette, subfamily B, bacterial PglK
LRLRYPSAQPAARILSDKDLIISTDRESKISLIGAIRQSLALLEPAMRREFKWLIVVACIASGLEATGVIVAFELIRLVLEPDLTASLPIMGMLIDLFDLKVTSSFLVFAAVVMAVFFLLKNIFLGYAAYVQSYFGNAAGMQLSYGLLRRYLKAPYEATLSQNSSELIVKAGQASYFISSRILASTVCVITEILIIVGVLAVLIYNEPLIALVTSVALGLSMALFYLITRPLYERWGEKQLRYDKRVTKNMYESLRSIKEIKILQCADLFLNEFLNARRKQVRVNTNSHVVSTLPRLITETMIVSSVALVIVIILLSDRPSNAVLSTLGLFAFAGFRVAPSMNRFTTALGTIRQGIASLENVRDDYKIMIDEDSPTKSHTGTQETFEFKTQLDVKNLDFRYAGTNTDVLNNISFSIKQGMFIGVTGSSGAGKSTLIDLVLGLLQPNSGEILLDGRAVNTRASQWRSMFGYVPQEISLIDDSIRRNIALGIIDEEIDNGKINEAIHLAAIQDIVGALPDGHETAVGEWGAKFSGGQRQRIGIARALYRDAKILIMDEVTSALDTKTEKQIVDTLRKLAGEKTVIVIAHRLSTVQNCDLLLYMDNGKLIDTGTFDELRDKNSEFAEMVRYAEITGSTIGAHATDPANVN